jgi:glycosyltransferase involved in cell wall biosynthesis
MNKFGIVISTYRRPDGKAPFFLNRCLNSIKEQTYQNYKVFLIGDKYEDNLEFEKFGIEVIDKNKLYKQNLKFASERDNYSSNKNALWSYGGCYASEIGVTIALEDENISYICRLDHDDFWGPTHLENFNSLIESESADWMCSISTYLNTKLPILNSNLKYSVFYPTYASCIKSSVCMNQRTIPLRLRDIFKETGKVGLPSDADLWERSTKYMRENNLKSMVINELTCFHDEEGYTKK